MTLSLLLLPFRAFRGRLPLSFKVAMYLFCSSGFRRASRKTLPLVKPTSLERIRFRASCPAVLNDQIHGLGKAGVSSDCLLADLELLPSLSAVVFWSL